MSAIIKISMSDILWALTHRDQLSDIGKQWVDNFKERFDESIRLYKCPVCGWVGNKKETVDVYAERTIDEVLHKTELICPQCSEEHNKHLHDVEWLESHSIYESICERR